jgi:crossover junction endodeoxyribonuclease RuvC
MIVLGIDPGTATTGYGVVTDRDSQPSMVTYGAILTPAGQALPDRLITIHNEVLRLIDEYHPEQAAVEQLFFNKNVRTALAVGHARGVVLLALAERNVPIFEYTPLEVKQAVTGNGRADKKQIQEMIKILLELDKIPKPDDAADALAIAVCHFHSARYTTLME